MGRDWSVPCAGQVAKDLRVCQHSSTAAGAGWGAALLAQQSSHAATNLQNFSVVDASSGERSQELLRLQDVLVVADVRQRFDVRLTEQLRGRLRSWRGGVLTAGAELLLASERPSPWNSSRRLPTSAVLSTKSITT